MPQTSPEEDEKDSKGLIFKEERFEMQKMSITGEKSVLEDPQRLVQFVEDSQSGANPPTWLSQNEKEKKVSMKIVGQTFEKLVYDGKRDALVLVYHPLKAKNRGLKKKFEAFAKNYAVNGK